MTGDNALNIGQANPGSLEFLLRMQALKYAKELVGVGHAEADAVVFDIVNQFAVTAPATNLDDRRRLLPRLPWMTRRSLSTAYAQCWQRAITFALRSMVCAQR